MPSESVAERSDGKNIRGKKMREGKGEAPARPFRSGDTTTEYTEYTEVDASLILGQATLFNGLSSRRSDVPLATVREMARGDAAAGRQVQRR